MSVRPNRIVAIVFGLAVTATMVGCKGSAMSKRDEIQIGREASRYVEEEFKLDPDPHHQELVQEIGQRLIIANGMNAYPYSFKVLDSNEINAFSLPGGPVYVFRGTVEAANRDELAGVLAHELGHVNARHIAKQYTKGLWMNIAASVVTGGRGSDVANILIALQQLSFSRKDEYEADDESVRCCYRAGFDPNGIVTFFEKLKAKEKGGDKGILANFRTHPLTENRMVHAREQIAKITGAPPMATKR